MTSHDTVQGFRRVSQKVDHCSVQPSFSAIQSIMQIYSLTIPKSSLGAGVKNLPWHPSYIQAELCCTRKISCVLFPYKSILWTVCLPNPEQQQCKKVVRASGSHLAMAVTSHQVKGNNDDPSLQHSKTITVLAWLSSFMISQEQFLNEEDKTAVLSNCHLGSQGLVCSKCTVSIFPICSWRSVRGVRARMSPGNASSRLRCLNRNTYGGDVCLGNPAQLRRFMKRFCSPTLVSARSTEMPPIFKGISHNIRWFCVDKFRPGSLFTRRA